MQACNVVAIVDPLSTGAYLAPEFCRRGWSAVAVISGDAIPDAFVKSFRSEDFIEVLTHSGQTDSLVEALRMHGVSVVVAGTEHGVQLADELAEVLGLPGNGTALSTARRDKFVMGERVRAAGVPVAASIVTDDVEEMIAWANRLGHASIVVKPVASAGSDGVAFCSGPNEIRRAFARIHGEVNPLGVYNRQVLAQERLVGEQYFVNTVSREGRHFIAEIWKDVRIISGDHNVYDREDLQSATGPLQEELTHYVVQVLDALGIHYGPAHTEVMMTAAGPVLIECAARMQGAVNPEPHRMATGHSQVSLTVDCYTAPDEFDALIGVPYRLDKHLRVVSLIAPFDGEVLEGAALVELLALPTLVGAVRELRPGTPVRKTVDLFTSPAHFYLLGEAADIDRDYARIRVLEAGGLYGGARLFAEVSGR